MYQEQRNRTFSSPTFTTSSSRNPASDRSHSEAALADPGSALRLGSFFEKCGVKNACSVVVVVFFPRRNFRPGNQTYPRQRGHWSSMFPLKFLPTVGKKQELEMLEWNTCSGWLHYHIWSIATALKRASGVLQNENARGPEQAPWGTPKAEHSYLFSAKEPLSAFLDALLSTPMSL